jgi:hypothetical protein
VSPAGQGFAERTGEPDQWQPPRQPTDRPRPWSREDLQQRLERLPRGHPSSPYNADGSRKPPLPDLRRLQLPPSGEPAGTGTGTPEHAAAGPGDHREP